MYIRAASFQPRALVLVPLRGTIRRSGYMHSLHYEAQFGSRCVDTH
jgi:hypothetical protein